MKILIVENNLRWKTWDEKIKSLQDWFLPLGKFDFTIKKSNFKDIPFTTETNAEGVKHQGIYPKWYDENITSQAIGYDTVIFVVPPKLWKGKNVQGAYMYKSNGINRIYCVGNEHAKYDFMGVQYQGDQFFNIARHEITHALYYCAGKKDMTHIYWQTGNLAQTLFELKTNPIVSTITNFVSPPKKYKYFNQSEIDGLNTKLVEMLDLARGYSGVPFKLTSTIRSEEKNKEVGGVKDSSHTKGLAVDIACNNSSDRYKILTGLLKAGFTRLGISYKKNFIHVDIDKSKPQMVIWGYED